MTTKQADFIASSFPSFGKEKNGNILHALYISNKNKCMLINSELAGSDYSVNKRSRGKDYTDYTGARKFIQIF